jgi:hypothetical protein
LYSQIAVIGSGPASHPTNRSESVGVRVGVTGDAGEFLGVGFTELIRSELGGSG